MLKINYALPLVLLLSGAANAATENPWYAGARLGDAHYSDFSDKNNSLKMNDDGDLAGGFFLGYNFAPWFALETGYTYLGDMDLEHVGSIKQQGIDMLGKFTWNASDSLDLFVKAGGFYYFTEGQKPFNAADDNGLTATAGLGVEYFLNKNISARIEYQYYHDLELSEVPLESHWDTHFYGLSLVYSWGAPKPIAVLKAPAIVEPATVAKKQEVIKAQPNVVTAPVEIAPLTIELPFRFDRKSLPQKYLDKLSPIAKHLIDYPQAQLFIVGHTDSSGSNAYNQKLSEQRAALVAKYLENQFAIDKSRIKASGHGEREPIASNHSAEGRARNRRVSVFTPGLKISNK